MLHLRNLLMGCKVKVRIKRGKTSLHFFEKHIYEIVKSMEFGQGCNRVGEHLTMYLFSCELFSCFRCAAALTRSRSRASSCCRRCRLVPILSQFTSSSPLESQQTAYTSLLRSYTYYIRSSPYSPGFSAPHRGFEGARAPLVAKSTLSKSKKISIKHFVIIRSNKNVMT